MRIVYFRLFAADDPQQIIPQLFAGYAHDLPFLGNGNGAGFLGNDNRDRVGDFRDTDRRPMP